MIFYSVELYTSSATLNSATTSFTTGNQVPNSGQYTSGGGKLVNNATSITAGVARVDFADRSFTNVTITARGALIYNTSFSNAAVAVTYLLMWEEAARSYSIKTLQMLCSSH